MQAVKVIDYIVGWLESYRADAGMSGFVVGVSGGVDSAVTSTLCARTGHKVVLLNLPIYQNPKHHSLARRHIEWLTQRFDNAKATEIDLTWSFQAIESALPKEVQDDLNMANMRSRLRMLTIYAFAGHYRLLVAGTGNKVEDFGVGFYTKYGDGGVDLSPIADLVKTEVYELARELGIAEDILGAAPTDGLWGDGRTDESQMGATYPELEWAMEFENGLDPGTDPGETDGPHREADLNKRQREVLGIYRRLHRANHHKMIPIPFPEIGNSLK